MVALASPLRRRAGHTPCNAVVALCCGLLLGGSACAPADDPDVLMLRTWHLGGEAMTLPGSLPDQRGSPSAVVALHASVKVPAALQREPLELSVPVLEAPVALRVDGELVPPHERAREYRRALPHRFTLPSGAAADGQLDLVLEVTQTWRKAGWLGTVPRITAARAPDPLSRWLEVTNGVGSWLALGVLLQVGLTCLLVFALDRRRQPYLWFGVQAISASTYPLFIAGLTTPILGHLDLPFTMVGLVVALTASLVFTHSFFALGPVPRWLLALMGLSAAASLVVLDPFLVVDLAVPLVVASVTLSVAYQLATIWRLCWQRPESRMSLALLGGGWLALAGTTWCDSLHWLLAIEPLNGMRPSCLGLAVFGLFLSLLLSLAHIQSLSEADGLNASLSRQVVEVAAARHQLETMNQELRRHIGDRSAQLFAAIRLSLGRPDQKPRDLAIGSEINGRYRVEEMLGAGTMGTVYCVTRLSDGARLAMKVAGELQGAALARLAREAHILSQLRHANVVHILDIDVAAAGFVFVILELVDGASLRTFLREHGTMSVSEAIPVLRQIALGLAALHEANIAHRDLKPDNVLLLPTASGVLVKIADFGISRLDERTDPGSAPGREDGGAPDRPGKDGTSSSHLPRAEQSLADAALGAQPSNRPVAPVGALLDELEKLDERDERDERGERDEVASPSALATGEIGVIDHGWGGAQQQDPGRGALATADGSTAVLGWRWQSHTPGSASRPAASVPRPDGTGIPSSFDLTGAGALSGTPHYMAPELARSGPASDPLADIYSFGVLTYELLTGNRPFTTPLAVLLMRERPEQTPSAPELPPEHAILGPLVARCLANDPRVRPSALEVASMLEALAADPQVAKQT